MSYGPSLLEQLWLKLDALVDANTPDLPEDQKLINKGKMLGFAEAILLFHHPIFSTITEVSQEARRRKKARDAGEEYETQGLNSRKYELPRSEDATAAPAQNASPAVLRAPVAASQRRTGTRAATAPSDPLAAKAAQIPPDRRALLKKAKQPAEALSAVFGYEPEVIDYIRNQP